MAKANLPLIRAIRRTAEKLQTSIPYQWGHMGSCNFGHLAQEITNMSKKELHARALNSRSGDWSEQLIDYCPTSGLPFDEVIYEMLSAGLDREDLMMQERLSDQRILQSMPEKGKNLQHNRRNDVIIYLNAWANLLENQWLQRQKKSSIAKPEVEEIYY